jgi:protein TonB
VTLLVVVDGEGQPVSISVQKTSGHGILDRAAVAAVEGWRFRPANRGALAPRRTRVLHFTFAPRDGLKR